MDNDSELIRSGHRACQGCSERLAQRYTLMGLGRNTVIAVPAGCSAVVDGIYPDTASEIPYLHTPFGPTASIAVGIRAGLDMLQQEDVTVLAWSGDGGTFDIGFQSLSSAAEKNENIIFVCYDNEAYMNTGIQRSSATPHGAWTSTTPLNGTKHGNKKNIMDIMVAHRIPYAATGAICFPEDIIRKMEKAKKMKGFRFFHIFAPCPTGWKFPPGLSVKMARLAVQSKIFPIYEVEDQNYKLNFEPDGRPIDEYMKSQGRFKHLSEKDIVFIQKQVDSEWERLIQKAQN